MSKQKDSIKVDYSNNLLLALKDNQIESFDIITLQLYKKAENKTQETYNTTNCVTTKEKYQNKARLIVELFTPLNKLDSLKQLLTIPQNKHNDKVIQLDFTLEEFSDAIANLTSLIDGNPQRKNPQMIADNLDGILSMLLENIEENKINLLFICSVICIDRQWNGL